MKTLIRSLAFVCALLCSGLSLAAFGQNCSSPANPIEAENCLPGNPPSQWDVSGAGDIGELSIAAPGQPAKVQHYDAGQAIFLPGGQARAITAKSGTIRAMLVEVK